MTKFLSFRNLSVLFATFLLMTGAKMNAESQINQSQSTKFLPNAAGPCDSKIVVECGVTYTANLIPSAGSWANYTGVPYNYTGSEQVFQFTASTSGLYIFDLDQGQGDADFMIMNACSNSAGNVTNFYWTGEHKEYIKLTAGVTYYIIADLYQSSGATTVSLKVDCVGSPVIPVPNFSCYQGPGIASTLDEALNLDPLNPLTFVANDFTVAPNTTFTLREITMDTNQVQVPDHAVFNFRKDNNGVPGTVMFTAEAAVTSNLVYSVMFNEPVYHLTFDLAQPITFTEGVYWIEPKLTTPEPSTVWWVATGSKTDGSPTMLSEDGGNTWTAMTGLETIFFVAGECGNLGTSDVDSLDFSYYPNPVVSDLNIQTKKSIKAVEIYNVAGQKMLTRNEVKSPKINLEKLTPGVYVVKVTFDNNAQKVFKILKK